MTAGETGARGEALALDCLLGKGYVLLGRNLHLGRQELDLVMRDGETLVFVEVKTRSRTDYGTPGAYVDERKRRNLIMAAERYLMENGLTESFARFDVVEVYLREGRVAHLVDAFTA